jgi:hypothetical protein
MRIADLRKETEGVLPEAPIVLSDGSVFLIPSSWRYGYNWDSGMTVATAISWVTRLLGFVPDHHLVFSYGKYSAHQLAAVPTSSVKTATRQNRYSSPSLAPKTVETCLGHVKRMLEYLDTSLGKKRLYYFGVIETKPMMHLHLLTRGTASIQEPEKLKGLWVSRKEETPTGTLYRKRGNVENIAISDDDHRKDLIAYLHKSYGQDDSDSRFLYKLPRGMLTDVT